MLNIHFYLMQVFVAQYWNEINSSSTISSYLTKCMSSSMHKVNVVESLYCSSYVVSHRNLRICVVEKNHIIFSKQIDVPLLLTTSVTTVFVYYDCVDV